MKPRIFVSSVSGELKSSRQLVVNTLLALGYEPIWQDIFETSGQDIRPMLREKIDSCSAVLQIVGDAYGAEPPRPDETFGRVSYTQYEAIYAKAHGKKVYYLVAQSEMPRDSTPESIDIPIDASTAAGEDAKERQALQRTYRARVQSTEHIFYPIQSHLETELSVRRLKEDLDRLRRRFQSWMVGVSVALVVLVGGVFTVNRGLWRQEEKIDQTQLAINLQTKELKKLTAEVDNPERIRFQLERTIRRAYDSAILEADKLVDWRKRDVAKKHAAFGRDQNLGRVDEFLKSIESVLQSGQASPEYLEMTRIFTEQGAEEAIAYIATRKEELFAKFDRDQDLNRTMNLLPILEAVRKEVLLGRYEAARENCDQLLRKDPNWGDALHQQIWIYCDLGDRAMQYESVLSATEAYRNAFDLANRLNRLSVPHPEALYDLSASLDRLGNSSLKMGKTHESLAHFQSGFAIRQELVAGNPRVTRLQRSQYISHNHIGDVLLQMGRRDEALAHYESGLKISFELASEDERPPAQRDLSVSHIKLGEILLQMVQLEKALGHFKGCLGISEALAAADPDDAQIQGDMSVACDGIGDVMLQIGRPQDARLQFETGLKIRQKLAASDANNRKAQRELWVSYNKLGFVLLKNLGRPKDAFDHFDSALKISKRLATSDSGDMQSQHDLSISYDALGDVLLQLDRAKDAISHYVSGLDIRRMLAADDPVDAQLKCSLSISHNKLGDVLLSINQKEKACEHFESALKLREGLAADHPRDKGFQRDLSASFSRLGTVLLDLGQQQKAVEYCESALELRKELASTDPQNAQSQRELANSHDSFGDILLELGNQVDARGHYELAMEIREKLASKDLLDTQARRDLVVSHHNLANVLLKEGAPVQALVHSKSMLEICQELARDNPMDLQAERDLSKAQDLSGDILFLLDRTQEAIAHFEYCVNSLEKLAADSPRNVPAQFKLLQAYSKLADVFLQVSSKEKAQACILSGINTLDRLIATGQYVEQSQSIKRELEQELAKLKSE